MIEIDEGILTCIFDSSVSKDQVMTGNVSDHELDQGFYGVEYTRLEYRDVPETELSSSEKVVFKGSPSIFTPQV